MIEAAKAGGLGQDFKGSLYGFLRWQQWVQRSRRRQREDSKETTGDAHVPDAPGKLEQAAFE